MEKQIERQACKNCIHYQMCVGSYREGIRRGDYREGSEEEFFADTMGCDFYADNRIYRKQEWISVEERLPEREGKYLAYTRKGTIAICDYRSYFMTKEGALSEPQFDYWVTHWMPLPEPPKGE